MKKPKIWWSLIALLIVWSLWEIYPPTSRNLIDVFQEEASNKDPKFDAIVSKARDLEKLDPDPHKQFDDVFQAVGTNNIQPYFPYIDVKTEERPTYTLLNVLQRKASGKIKLGIDLKGGMQFLVSLDTNHVTSDVTNAP